MRTLLLLRLLFVVGVSGLLVNATNTSGNIVNNTDNNSNNSNNNKMNNNKVKKSERELVIEQVEQSLLSMLRLPKRPQTQITDKAEVPDSMIQLYNKQKSLQMADIAKPGAHTGTANTVRSFSHVESELDEKFQSPNRFRLYFNVSSIPLHESLTAAELSLSRVSHKVSSDRNIGKILIYDIVRPGVKGKNLPQLRLLDSKTIDGSNNHTINMDVLPAVSRWLEEKAHNNYGLLIKIVGIKLENNKHPHVRLKRGVNENNENWMRNSPLLFTYTDDGHHKMKTSDDIIERRRKRAAAIKKNHRRKDGQIQCRRHPLYVDFADVGWNDWIVAPPGYDAFYCHGDCPHTLAAHLNSTNHAIVQNLMHSVKPEIVPKACCVPTTLSSISMLYLDEENKVVLKNYQDMAVLGCGCR